MLPAVTSIFLPPAEYLMPEIGEYAGEVLPLLFHFVDSALAELNSKGKVCRP